MAEEQIQPQEESVQEAKQAGAETPQQVEQPEQPELGAEVKPQVEEIKPSKEAKPPRHYTQEEWSKRESAKDTESAQLRNQLAQATLQLEQFKQERAETEARAQDKKDLTDGLITESELTQREQTRQRQRQTTEAIARQEQTFRQMLQKGEQLGRVLFAQDVGKEFELSEEQITELLADKDIKTPDAMRAKAANLENERLRGELKKAKEVPPKFASGQAGGAGEPSPDKSLKERYPSMYKK